MSAFDDNAEGLTSTGGALAERASGPESDVVAMKRYTAGDIYRAVEAGLHNDTEFRASADADREIGKQLALLAARDARIAELCLEIAGHHFVRNERDRLDKALASRDAEIVELRRLVTYVVKYSSARELLPGGWIEDANAALTPPSQAPVAASLRGPEGAARRDVGGEKL